MVNELGGDKPWQVNAFAGHGKKAGRMEWYRLGLLVATLGAALWYFESGEKQKSVQGEAVKQFGRHGEKAEYGGAFQSTVQKGDHFPGFPTTDTNVRGGHPGGAKS